jgi:hypothetical protein
MIYLTRELCNHLALFNLCVVHTLRKINSIVFLKADVFERIVTEIDGACSYEWH